MHEMQDRVLAATKLAQVRGCKAFFRVSLNTPDWEMHINERLPMGINGADVLHAKDAIKSVLWAYDKAGTTIIPFEF